MAFPMRIKEIHTNSLNVAKQNDIALKIATVNNVTVPQRQTPT